MPHGWLPSGIQRSGIGAFPRVGHAPVSTLTYAKLILTTGTEGEEYTVAEGGTYTWSDVANVGWIRKEAYDVKGAGLARIANIDGDVTPANETPAWDDSIWTWGDGTVTSDGTWVKWDASGDAGGAYSLLVNQLSDAKWLWRGYVHLQRLDDSTYTFAFHFTVPSGGFYKTVNFYTYYPAESRMALRGYMGGAKGEYVETDIRGEVVYLEILLDFADYVQVFVNNQASWALRAMMFSNRTGYPSYDFEIDCDCDATAYGKDISLIRLT